MSDDKRTPWSLEAILEWSQELSEAGEHRASDLADLYVRERDSMAKLIAWLRTRGTMKRTREEYQRLADAIEKGAHLTADAPPISSDGCGACGGTGFDVSVEPRYPPCPTCVPVRFHGFRCECSGCTVREIALSDAQREALDAGVPMPRDAR